MDYQTKMKIKRWMNKPFVTYGFLAIQTVVYAIIIFFPAASLESRGVMFGPYIYFYHEYWRFVTPIFIHFSLLHFVVNSLVLYFIGQQVEAIYGHWRFFLLYLLSGVMGNAMSFAFNTAGIQSAGSSTSIFGVFGAFLLLGYYFKHNPAIQGMVRQFALFVGMSLLFGVFDRSIDMWGHIGGIIGGLLLGNMLTLPKNHGNFSIHARILSTLLFVFLLAVCILYGLRKYSLLF